VLIKDGETIRFGTDIYRGQQTFPPCTVQVGLSWNQEQVYQSWLSQLSPAVLTMKSRNLCAAPSGRATPSNTFSVPDYDDEDLISDNDDVVETDKPLATRLEHQSIDLTRESPLPPARSNVTITQINSDLIDLTSEPEVMEKLDETVQLPSSDAATSRELLLSTNDSTLELEPSHIRSSPSASDLASQKFSEHFSEYSSLYEPDSEVLSIDGETSLEAASSADSSASDGHMSNEDISMHASNMSDSESNLDESNHEYSTSDELDETDEQDEGASTSYPTPAQTYPLLTDLHNIPDWEDGMSSDSDDDDETDPSLFEKTDSPAVNLPSSSSPTILAASCTSKILPPRPAYDDGVHDYSPTLSLISTRPIAMPRIMQCNHPSLTDHHPSPSYPLAVEAHPIEESRCALSSKAQLLGDRTGKYDFFSAREHNRASVMGNPLIPDIQTHPDMSQAIDFIPKSATTLTSAHITQAVPTNPSTLPPWRELEPPKDAIGDISLDASHDLKGPFNVSSAWQPFGDAFLKEPYNYPLSLSDERTRLQSPELDMTSAATFAESKNKLRGDTGRSRRRLAVKFLISQESKETSPTPNNGNDISRPLKRSYDEVFSDPNEQSPRVRSSPSPNLPHLHSTNNGIDDNETNEAVASTSGMPAEMSSAVDVKAVPEDETVSAAGPSISSPICAAPPTFQGLDTRATKRRRFSKFAKYASVSVVSGVTSAALVFAGLAATAPQIV
jgi:hypothetical protein